jgi:hypothetical protein
VNVETSPIVLLMRHVVAFMSYLVPASVMAVAHMRMLFVAVAHNIVALVITPFVILKMDCVSKQDILTLFLFISSY